MSIERFEQIITLPSGQELFFQIWQPQEHTNSLIISHGLGEHSDCYNNLATQLCKSLNWSIIAWDLQGHGRSSGKRGFVLQFENYLEDFAYFMNFLQKNDFLKQPPALLGHSLGGLITLRYYLEDKPKIKGICLNAPALGLSITPSPIKEKIAKIANSYFPHLTLDSGLKKEDTIQDKDLIELYYRDPLRHTRISPRLFTGMVESFKIAKNFAHEIKAPLLMQLAGQDKVVSTDASLNFFKSLKSLKEGEKKCYLYNESYHDILNDVEKEKAITDLKAFLNELK